MEGILSTEPSAVERARRVAQEPFADVNAPERFFAGTGASLRALWQRRELLGLLTRRELAAKYKDSSLGVVWSLIRPIAQHPSPFGRAKSDLAPKMHTCAETICAFMRSNPTVVQRRVMPLRPTRRVPG